MENPKKLFLLDAAGALLSAFLLGFVLVKFQSYFGIPVKTLYFLAVLPCFFALYDLYCFKKVKNNIGQHLKIIAGINILYCSLSIGIAIFHHAQITQLGWGYIILEILIVLYIAYLELKVAKRLA